MERYRALIENGRLYGSITLGFLTAISGNIIMGISIVLTLGIIDHIFITPKLKS